jgi:type IV pilus assembly protein PilZ
MTDPNGHDPASSGDPRDRRREPRYPVDIEADYAADDTFLFANVTDISTLGIFLRTEAPLPKGTQLTLRFTLPVRAQLDVPRGDENLSTPEQPEPRAVLLVRGQVMWTSDGGEGGRPGMGVQFVEMDTATRSRILELVRAVAYLG